MAGTTKIVTWSGGPTGDYVCDGTNDEVQINQALAWANSNPNNIIKMRGSGDTTNPHKYHIQAQVKVGSYTIWTAEPGACLWVPDGACGTNVSNCVFPNGTSVIGQLGSYVTKLEIYGFEIDGNCQNQSTVLGYAHGKLQSAGSGVERLIQLRGLSGSQTKASDIYIHDVKGHDAFGELAHISFATNVRIKDNYASNHQHDCIYCAEVHGDGNDISGNTLYGITDSTIRLDCCQNVPVHNNYFYSYDGANNNGATKFGHNGMQIANNPGTSYTLLTNNITVYNNYFEGKNLCGIWINDQKKTAGATAQTVHIHHNSFRLETGWADWAWWSSGVNIGPWGNGVLIEYNTFDGCYANTVQATNVISSSSTHTATVRYNNIINTMGKRAGSTDGPSIQGWGIWNAVPTKLTIKAEQNYMSGNLAGNYTGLTPISTSDEPILTAGPEGGTGEDDPVEPDDPITPTPSWVYVPSTARILSTDFGYVERAADDYDAYINGVPVDVWKFTSAGSKVVPKSHSPRVPGSNLGDLGAEGSVYEINFNAKTIDEAHKIMASFSREGRSFYELGGPNKGYFISGVMSDHSSGYDKLQGDIPEEGLDGKVLFDAEFPYEEWMTITSRSRYISESCRFASSDIRNGNLVKNPNFAAWTPKQTLEWKLIKRDAVDNDWQNVKFSSELNQWCAVAKSGTVDRIMVSGPQLVTDLSGAYHTGIYTGDVTPLSTGGLTFGGTDGYVDIPLPDIANAAEFTIYSKISTTITGTTQTITGLGRYNSTNPLLVLWVDATGHAVIYHRDDAGTTATITGGVVADGLPHEICLVKSGTSYILYVDNVEAGTTTATIGQCSVNEANIGRTPRPSAQYYFEGNVYSTRIFSRALSSAEVPKAYVGTTGLLQAYASVITDEPGNFWAIPPSLSRISSPDQLWTGLTWCSDWMLWVAFSSSQSGLDCAISPDGVNWELKSTPLNREWSDCLFIPKNETLTTGRLIVFAKAGTGPRTMYSNDKCDSWTEVDIPADVSTNSVSSSTYSPSLRRVVAVCNSGSATKRVICSDDYGATYSSITSPAQAWSGVVWADLLEIFAACSEDGTNQIITSPSGLEGTWTQRSTPYAYTETTGGTVVKTIADQTQEDLDYETLVTDYTASGNPIVSFLLPAPASGNHYRVDNVECLLKIASSGKTASLKITAQTATIAETTIKEWTETSTEYQVNSFNCLFEGAADETVTIRAYLKTSLGTVKASASSVGYTASEMNAGSSTITYHRNTWTDIAYARDLNLLAVVCKDTDHINYVMYCSNGINWYKAQSLASQAWTSIEYSDTQKAFVSVAGTGTYRVQISKGYGSFVNVAPSLWRKVTDGQQSSTLHTHDSDMSFLIEGDGTTEDPGEISQKLSLDSLYDSGELYILLGYGYVEGLTQGSYRVEIYAGGTVVKSLVWNANTEDITEKEIKFRFDPIPSSAYIRIRGVGTPNLGSKFYCGFCLVSKMSEYDTEDVGTEITTDGYYDCIPNIKLRGVGSTANSGTSNRIIEDTDTEIYPTTALAYELIKTVTLPALAAGSKYQLNKLSFQFQTNNLGAYVYCKTTIQAASLFGGVEKDISVYSTNLTDYQSRSYDLPYDLISATNETVTLRWYAMISKTGYTGFVTNLHHKFTEIQDIVTTSETPIYVYNASNTLNQLQICNRLPAGFLIEINKDSTGAIRYVEPFEDDRYIKNAYRITGTVARDRVTQTLHMSTNSAYEILIDSLFAVASVPFIKLFVTSGIPQISIAADVEGVPGTYYSVDGNTSQAVENIDVVRLLNNEQYLKLRGSNKFFVKIEPLSGQTCVIGQMLIYSSLDTMDVQRIFIYAAEKPNTIGAYVGGAGKCSAVLSLEYRKTNILP